MRKVGAGLGVTFFLNLDKPIARIKSYLIIKSNRSIQVLYKIMKNSPRTS